MMIYLIRHGKTEGDLSKAYIGSTDEPLCPQGAAELSSQNAPEAKIIISSTQQRCIESAALFYPERQVLAVEGLEECDFGEYECKTYEEIGDTEEYQNWLDSCGEIPFPGGEPRSAFSARCADAFAKCIYDLLDVGAPSCTFILHEGTIMSVLEHFAEEKKAYYLWKAEHGHGFSGEIDDTLWIRNIKEI